MLFNIIWWLHLIIWFNNLTGVNLLHPNVKWCRRTRFKMAPMTQATCLCCIRCSACSWCMNINHDFTTVISQICELLSSSWISPSLSLSEFSLSLSRDIAPCQTLTLSTSARHVWDGNFHFHLYHLNSIYSDFRILHWRPLLSRVLFEVYYHEATTSGAVILFQSRLGIVGHKCTTWTC